MIRFSAFLVVVAVGTLVAGVVTSKLLLVYIAIGVSGLALLALGAGAAVHWRELTGKPETAAAGTPAAAGTSTQAPVSSPPSAAVPPQVATPEPATAASRPAWSGAVPAGSSRPGYLPPEPPPVTRPTPVSEWKWRDDPAPREAAAGKLAEDQPPAPDDDLSVQDQTMIFRQPDQTMIFRAQPAAEEAAPPSDDGDGDGEPAADAPAPAGTVTEDNAVTADDTATAGDSSSKADAEPADDAAPSDAAAPDVAAPDDEPEPADDATTIAKAVAPVAAPASDLEVTVVPGVPRYHKANCILIRFMGDSDLDTMTVAAAREAGCTPCRACLPDQSEESPELSGAPDPEPQA